MGVSVRGPVSVSVPMPVIVFVERLRVCFRGHVSVTMSVYVSVDTSQCSYPVRIYGHGSVLIVFLSWTRVRVRVRAPWTCAVVTSLFSAMVTSL